MALDAREKEIIASTVPILEQGGELLTSHFYSRMMQHNPEVRKFFNQTHQRDGTQAHALARAVLLYAKNIDHLENLGAIAPIIIEKHVALDIMPEHYPIVGTNLIAAMTEVLGPETATSEVLEAWTKAYGQLADILIDAEKAEYHRIENLPGGWSGFRKFTIKSKSQAAKGIVSFWLEPSDGKPIVPSKPGQYITLRVDVEGSECRRNYSVSSSPSEVGYEISVKNIGLVSSYLHGLQENDEIDVRPPLGSFIPEPNEKGSPLVFIAGGIGITPLAAMLRSGCKGKLLYYAHSDEERALLSDLKSLEQTEYVPVGQSRPSLDEIKAHVPENAIVYYTGPMEFMKTIRAMLISIGVPEENAHYELFGSGQVLY